MFESNIIRFKMIVEKRYGNFIVGFEITVRDGVVLKISEFELACYYCHPFMRPKKLRYDELQNYYEHGQDILKLMLKKPTKYERVNKSWFFVKHVENGNFLVDGGGNLDLPDNFYQLLISRVDFLQFLSDAQSIMDYYTKLHNVHNRMGPERNWKFTSAPQLEEKLKSYC